MLAGHTVEDGAKTWKLTLRDGLCSTMAARCWGETWWPACGVGRVRDAFAQALMDATDELSAPTDKRSCSV